MFKITTKEKKLSKDYTTVTSVYAENEKSPGIEYAKVGKSNKVWSKTELKVLDKKNLKYQNKKTEKRPYLYTVSDDDLKKLTDWIAESNKKEKAANKAKAEKAKAEKQSAKTKR